MPSHERVTTPDLPQIGFFIEQARRRDAAAIVEEGRVNVSTLQKRIEELQPRHTERAQEYYYLLGKQYQLSHLIESLHTVIEAGSDKPEAIVVDNMQISHEVLALPEDKFFLPPGPKYESLGAGVLEARERFTSFLSRHEVGLIPWSRTAMYHIMTSQGDLSSEYTGKIETVLEGTYYEYYYPAGITIPVRTLIINPLQPHT